VLGVTATINRVPRPDTQQDNNNNNMNARGGYHFFKIPSFVSKKQKSIIPQLSTNHDIMRWNNNTIDNIRYDRHIHKTITNNKKLYIRTYYYKVLG